MEGMVWYYEQGQNRLDLLPQDLHDLADLIALVLAAKQRLARVHLHQRAAQAPHVNCLRN